MTYMVAVFSYGDPMEDGLGAYVHPDGGSAALTVCALHVGLSDDQAINLGIEYEKDRYVHHVVVEEDYIPPTNYTE